MVGKSKGKDSQMIVYIMIIMISCALFAVSLSDSYTLIHHVISPSPALHPASRDGSWQPSSKSTERKKTSAASTREPDKKLQRSAHNKME